MVHASYRWKRIKWAFWGPISRRIIYPIKLWRYGKLCKSCKRKYLPPPYKTRFSCATKDYCAGCAYDMDSYTMSEEEQWEYYDDYP